MIERGFQHKAEFVELDGLVEGVGRLDGALSLLSGGKKGSIVKVRGVDEGSWEALNVLRERLSSEAVKAFSPQLVVFEGEGVVLVRCLSCERVVADLVQVRERGVFFWWEIAKNMQGVVRGRVAMTCCKARLLELSTGTVIDAYIECPEKEFQKLEEEMMKAEVVEVKGMLVEASTNVMQQRKYMVVTELVCVEEDYGAADDILGKLKDWREIAPAVEVETGELLFSEETVLAMMLSTLYHKGGTAALNVVFFGNANSGKTSSLKFQVVDIIGGSFEAATASGGKGWLVTHKTGVLSKVFVERRAMLVDELFKAVSNIQKSNFHSYAMELNAFMQKHMQVLEKREMEASSGLGTVRGRMRCSFVGTENTDVSLQKALARADGFSQGPMRRFQFAYVESKKKEVGFSLKAEVGKVEAQRKAELYAKFGKNAMRGLRALYAYSRRFTDSERYHADKGWVMAMMESLMREVEVGGVAVPREFVPSQTGVVAEQDERTREKVRMWIDHHQQALQACWIAAAVVRGWEASNSLDVLEPVFDVRQREMAEMVGRYLFISKLRVFAPGMHDATKELSSIARV